MKLRVLTVVFLSLAFLSVAVSQENRPAPPPPPTKGPAISPPMNVKATPYKNKIVVTYEAPQEFQNAAPGTFEFYITIGEGDGSKAVPMKEVGRTPGSVKRFEITKLVPGKSYVVGVSTRDNVPRPGYGTMFAVAVTGQGGKEVCAEECERQRLTCVKKLKKGISPKACDSQKDRCLNNCK